jgi:formylglycine-generating enzyme required for sulfatase activity
MMDAPRRALSGYLVVFLIAAAALAQDPAKLAAEIKKAEEKLKEESDRVVKKKENLQVEFAALNSAEAKTALQAKLAEIGAKHKDAVLGKGAKGGDSKGTDTRPKVSDSLHAAIQEDCKQALAATVGRNLATVLDASFASNLITGLKDSTPIDYAALVNDTISIEFSGDFEANYLKLMPRFEAKKFELEGELAALKQKLADRQASDEARSRGLPPGMVLVKGGKVKIGMDAKEFELARKVLRFGPTQGEISMYSLGWPPHEVEIQDFYIDVNEVTCKAWSEFIRDTGRKPPKNWTVEKKDKDKEAAKEKFGIGSPDAPQDSAASRPASDGLSPPPGMENLPVTMITYDEVQLYLEWCGRRLPTEFEWEAAARFRPAGDSSIRMFPWGDTYDLLKAQCNNATAITHPLRQGRFALTPVGSFPQGKSALGLNDMAGNALEMTSSFFTSYPKWDPAKAPSKLQGKTPPSGSIYVLRGGGALSDEMWTLTTTRKEFSVQQADIVGFRTAASKVKGRDLIDSILGPTGQALAAPLEAAGPALKDEKSGRPELAVHDQGRFSARIAGGWDHDKQLPARAKHLAVILRNTYEIPDAARMKSLARDQKKPLMLAYFRTDVDFTKPALPKGNYWIMWDPGHTKVNGKEKLAVPEGLVFMPLAKRDELIPVPNVNPVVVSGSTDYTKFDIDKNGTNASLILCFPLKDRKEGRFVVEIKLEAGEGALKAYK